MEYKCNYISVDDLSSEILKHTLFCIAIIEENVVSDIFGGMTDIRICFSIMFTFISKYHLVLLCCP